MNEFDIPFIVVRGSFLAFKDYLSSNESYTLNLNNISVGCLEGYLHTKDFPKNILAKKKLPRRCRFHFIHCIQSHKH
jgi:hypothetical protein